MLWPKLAFLTSLGLLFGVTAWAVPGFQPANSPSVPLPIRRASINVLQIWTPVAFTWRNENKYATIQSNLETFPSELRRSIHFQMMSDDLHYCIAHKILRCRFTAGVTQGTAFVLPDGTLIAARHNFSQTKSGLQAKFAEMAANWNARLKIFYEKSDVEAEIAAFKADPLANSTFILTDAKGKIVFNSAQQTYRFIRFGELTRFVGKVDLVNSVVGLEGENLANEAPNYTGPDWLDQDSVRIQLSVRLPSLDSASAGCGPESPSYTVGYAGITTTSRAALGGRDAVYNELSVGSGKVLSLDDVARRSKQWAEAEMFFKGVVGRQTLLTDADGTDGLSGGPILNARGEVCGMFKASFPGNEHPRMNAQGFLDMFSLGIPLKYLTGI